MNDVLSQSVLSAKCVSTAANSSMGMPDGSCSLFRTSGSNFTFLEGVVGEFTEKDLILPSSSDPHLLELSGFECLNGEEIGVVRSSTVTGGFSISMVTAGVEVSRGVFKHFERCSPGLSSETSITLVNTSSPCSDGGCLDRIGLALCVT